MEEDPGGGNLEHRSALALAELDADQGLPERVVGGGRRIQDRGMAHGAASPSSSIAACAS